MIARKHQHPTQGRCLRYAGATVLAGLDSPGPPEEAWERLVSDVNRKHGGSIKTVSDALRLLCACDGVAPELAVAGARLH